MTPQGLANVVKAAHAIGERQENKVGIENFPREWQDMIVAVLEAFGAAQAPRETGWLVEWPEDDNVPVRWWNPNIGWMRDANKAMRFCRECDAADYINGTGHWTSNVKPTEHIFLSPVPSAQKNIKPNVDVMARDLIAAGENEYAQTPSQPTEAMLNAARDWSRKKYGTPIGDDAATGCWLAMHAASPVKPLSVCSRCGGKDPDCYICGTVVSSTEGKTKLIEPIDSAGMRGANKQAHADHASMLPTTEGK
jgi:hypothetical protein